MNKEELRSKYITKRKELSKLEIDTKTNLIFELIEKKFSLKNKKISLFLTIERLGELNTFLFLEKMKNSCELIATPTSNFQTNELVHINFTTIENIEISSFGIPESIGNQIIHPEKFDIVFVPLLTIDENGNRVGYGKGFYDRFLSKCKKECLFIGLNLFDEIESIDDLNKDDITLDFCVTPNKIITFDKNKK